MLSVLENNHTSHIESMKVYIAEAARICRVDPRTFRKQFVDKHAWIKPVEKTSWGWDRYDLDDVKALAKKLQKKRKKGYAIELED